MPRAFSPTALRAGVALSLVVGLAAPATGQTTLWDSGGFEGFVTGPIFSTPPFLPAPFNSAGMVQEATKLNGAKAFQVVGPSMSTPSYAGTGYNFWYREDAAVQFTATAATPYAQIRFSAMRTVSPLGTDMPFAGVYMESPSSSPGNGNSVGTTLFSSEGRIAVRTNFVAGGTDGTVQTTVAGQFAASTWYEVLTELNYNTQTFRVYVNGDPTPLQFLAENGTMLTDIPFSSTFGPSTGIEEIGMLAANYNAGGESAPSNNFFIDDFMVTYSNTSVAPVPEPSLVLAIGAAGLAGLRVYRRRKTG